MDFYCAETRLAIEIEGDTHAAPDQAAYNSTRTAWLQERSYKVIRVQARKVDDNFEECLKAIRAAREPRTGGISPEGR